MRSQRSILALRYTPVSITGGVRRVVGGFLRYVQYRDQHLEPETARALDAYVRYVAHRDRSAPGGRVFGLDGERGDVDRRQFVDYVARSLDGLQPKWVTGKDGKREDRQRAVYTFILSPDDWRGLDLRQLACAAMRKLEADTGPAGIGPWLAAEHRNTAHHHVHIVLAARREFSPGRFSTVVVTRDRLRRMKDAIALEIERQRALEHEGKTAIRAARSPAFATLEFAPPTSRTRRWLDPSRTAHARARRRRNHRVDRPIAMTILHFRSVARRYHQKLEHELEREQWLAEREGWLR